MEVYVCLKQVPDTEAEIRISDDGLKLVENNVKYIVNPYDEFALEEALTIKDNEPETTVTVITAGEEKARQAVISAYAVGADRGIVVRLNEERGYDSIFNATAVNSVLKSGSFDLILCGIQGVDYNNGQLPYFLGEMLDVPVVVGVSDIMVEEGGQSVRATKINNDGSKQVLRVMLPALLAITKGQNALRYSSLLGLKKARKKEIELVPFNEGLLENERMFTLESCYPCEVNRENIIINGSVDETAKKLYEYLLANTESK